MTPILFGDSTSPLFGVLHEPPPDAERGHGVLICPPIGQEHVRTHWALRQVAGALARAGHHVLRFDWYGIGDSAGDLSGASVARWVEDAQTAAQELRDAAGLRKIAVVGLRFGAALAALAARKIKPSTLLLWDPVTSGRAHLSEIKALHGRLLSDPGRFWDPWPEGVRRAVGRFLPDVEKTRAIAPDDYVGFRYHDALRKEIEAIEAQALAEVGNTRVVVLESDPREDVGAFVGRLAERGVPVERKQSEVRAHWDDELRVEELFLPADAVRLVTDVLAGRGA